MRNGIKENNIKSDYIKKGGGEIDIKSLAKMKQQNTILQTPIVQYCQIKYVYSNCKGSTRVRKRI
uniref:Uncharacterized protein n=1 Tax=Arundo donax TaxID=35708 RepID=A0A0A9H238_ARUDO